MPKFKSCYRVHTRGTPRASRTSQNRYITKISPVSFRIIVPKIRSETLSGLGQDTPLPHHPGFGAWSSITGRAQLTCSPACTAFLPSSILPTPLRLLCPTGASLRVRSPAFPLDPFLYTPLAAVLLHASTSVMPTHHTRY